MTESGVNNEQQQTHSSFELASSEDISISPEVRERIMEKAVDINTYGTAFHVLGADFHGDSDAQEVIYQAALKYGLLGGITDVSQRTEFTPEQIAAAWKSYIKTHPNAKLYFNVVGRMTDVDNRRHIRDYKPPLTKGAFSQAIANSEWIEHTAAPVAILFDTQTMREQPVTFPLPASENEEPAYSRGTMIPDYHVKSFLAPLLNQQAERVVESTIDRRGLFAKLDAGEALSPDEQEYLDDREAYIRKRQPLLTEEQVKEILKKSDLMSSHGDTANGSQYGFFVTSRVAPRVFTGVVFECDFSRNGENDAYEIDYDNLNAEEQHKVDTTAHKLMKTMLRVYKDKPELLVPIYNINGDMYWPQRMKYADVKAYVSQKNQQAQIT
jgi:hypothetical protein